MKAKSMKRFLTVALAATMVFGSTLISFAEDGETQQEENTTTAGEATGEGIYEGGAMKYPTLAVTLPTIPANTYDYIADPNGLIAATSAVHYPNSTFTGTTGVFFLTSAETNDEGTTTSTYTEKSAAQTVTNENAQDIKVTVKLEQTAAGSTGITYSDKATFESTDKANKLYLAVTDDAASDPNVSALSDTAAATVTTTVSGMPGNFVANYDEDDGYGYVEKEDATGWKSCSFILTGALNKNATWGDDVKFPTIKVTWTYEDASVLSISLDGTYSRASTENKFTISNLGDASISKIEALDGSNAVFAEITDDVYTLNGSTLTVDGTKAPWGAGAVGNTRGIKITLSTGETAETTFTVTQ